MVLEKKKGPRMKFRFALILLLLAPVAAWADSSALILRGVAARIGEIGRAHV